MQVKKIIFLISFGLVSVFMFSQENKDAHIKIMHGVNLNFKHSTGNPSTVNSGNNVFITQIGEDNYTNATVRSANSSQNIIQFGSSNYSASHLNSNKINTTIRT